MTAAPHLWARWLVLAFGAMALCSALALLLPGVTRAGLSLLVFGDAGALQGLEPGLQRYVGFLHGVLAAVMLGWSVALLGLAWGACDRGQRWAWQVMAASVAAWFVPGAVWSAWLHVWPNVALDVAVGLLFALPLAGLRRSWAG